MKEENKKSNFSIVADTIDNVSPLGEKVEIKMGVKQKVPGFPFMDKLEPLLEVDDNVELIPVDVVKKDRFFVVQQVEFIQPITLDIVTEDTTIASLAAATSSAYGKSSNFDMRDYIGLGDKSLMLAQYWVQPVDDILIGVNHYGGMNRMFDTNDLKTVIRKNNPRHTVTKRDSANNTEASIWITSSTLSDMIYTRRVAKIKKLLVDNESASTSIIRLGDGDGLGADASAANADISIEVAATSSVAIHEEELPEVACDSGIL